jgi:hypothetical protein
MSLREAIKQVTRALRTMTSGGDEFMAEIGEAMARPPPTEWNPAAEEMINSVLKTLKHGRATGPVDCEARYILAQGADAPILGGLVFPRPVGADTTSAPPPMPWFDHLEGEAADAWRAEVELHTSAVGGLTRLLEEGMDGVSLPGISTDKAVANCVVYGSGCLILAGGVGLMGNVRRLAGALMAYMLFDHVGDSLTDRRLRRMVHAEMMIYWSKGQWSERVPSAVAQILTGPIRRACEKSRVWVGDGRAPSELVRVGPQLGFLAKAIAKDCGVEAAVPIDQPIGEATSVDLPQLTASLKKNVAAVAFLLFAYLDDPRHLSPEVLHMAGRAAMFAQLFDDLLDRGEDIAQNQHTVMTGLRAEPYAHLAWVSAHYVPRILQDVYAVAPRMSALIRPLDDARVTGWVDTGGLLIYLMTRHRNVEAFGDHAAALAERTCSGRSPFVILRAVREWVGKFDRPAAVTERSQKSLSDGSTEAPAQKKS